MDERAFDLKESKIAILGLGLMGGSMALTLKKNCRQLSAFDIDIPTLELARRRKIVHVADSDPGKVLAGADMVILACPIPAILDWLARLTNYIQHPCIIMDIGSTKRTIMAALDKLPGNFDPLGGHAICGKERLALENSEKNLYRDAPFVLTPLDRTSVNARDAAVQIAEIIGAYPVWLNAEDHDRFLAYTSHLPYLISVALALVPPEEAKPFIGPGFKSTSRLAGTPINMMIGVLLSNRDNILAAIHQLQGELSTIESALQENDLGSLQPIFELAYSQYQSLIQ